MSTQTSGPRGSAHWRPHLADTGVLARLLGGGRWSPRGAWRTRAFGASASASASAQEGKGRPAAPRDPAGPRGTGQAPGPSAAAPPPQGSLLFSSSALLCVSHGAKQKKRRKTLGRLFPEAQGARAPERPSGTRGGARKCGPGRPRGHREGERPAGPERQPLPHPGPGTPGAFSGSPRCRMGVSVTFAAGEARAACPSPPPPTPSRGPSAACAAPVSCPLQAEARPACPVWPTVVAPRFATQAGPQRGSRKPGGLLRCGDAARIVTAASLRGAAGAELRPVCVGG